MGSLPLAVPTDLLAAAARTTRLATRTHRTHTLLVRWSTATSPELPALRRSDACFRLEEPARGFALHAEGSAAEVCTRGPERFAELTRGVEEVASTLQVVDAVRASGVDPVPAWVGIE